MCREILKDDPKFKKDRVISPEARDFLKSTFLIHLLELLLKQPKNRLDVKEVLEHPWLKDVKP